MNLLWGRFPSPPAFREAGGPWCCAGAAPAQIIMKPLSPVIWPLARQPGNAPWEMMTEHQDREGLRRLTSGERNPASGRLDCGVSGMLEPGARNASQREGCAATWWPRLHGKHDVRPAVWQADPRCWVSAVNKEGFQPSRSLRMKVEGLQNLQ